MRRLDKQIQRGRGARTLVEHQVFCPGSRTGLHPVRIVFDENGVVLHLSSTCDPRGQNVRTLGHLGVRTCVNAAQLLRERLNGQDREPIVAKGGFHNLQFWLKGCARKLDSWDHGVSQPSENERRTRQLRRLGGAELDQFLIMSGGKFSQFSVQVDLLLVDGVTVATRANERWEGPWILRSVSTIDEVALNTYGTSKDHCAFCDMKFKRSVTKGHLKTVTHTQHFRAAVTEAVSWLNDLHDKSYVAHSRALTEVPFSLFTLPVDGELDRKDDADAAF